MGDIFDYIFLFFASLFLAVLKVTGFIQWDWWVTAVPACVAFALHFITVIGSR